MAIMQRSFVDASATECIARDEWPAKPKSRKSEPTFVIKNTFLELVHEDQEDLMPRKRASSDPTILFRFGASTDCNDESKGYCDVDTDDEDMYYAPVPCRGPIERRQAGSRLLWAEAFDTADEGEDDVDCENAGGSRRGSGLKKSGQESTARLCSPLEPLLHGQSRGLGMSMRTCTPPVAVWQQTNVVHSMPHVPIPQTQLPAPHIQMQPATFSSESSYMQPGAAVPSRHFPMAAMHVSPRQSFARTEGRSRCSRSEVLVADHSIHSDITRIGSHTSMVTSTGSCADINSDEDACVDLRGCTRSQCFHHAGWQTPPDSSWCEDDTIVSYSSEASNTTIDFSARVESAMVEDQPAAKKLSKAAASRSRYRRRQQRKAARAQNA